MQNAGATAGRTPPGAFVVPPPAARPSEAYTAKLKAVRRELRDEYVQPHTKPWIVGFSGGKDSTLLAHLVVECVLNVSPDERRRRVHICSNDTLVESPVSLRHFPPFHAAWRNRRMTPVQRS
jgi:DNA sulfur modification protein DndC